MSECVLSIGLDAPEIEDLRPRLPASLLAHEMLPKLKLQHGRLFVEHPTRRGAFVETSHVVYHGIFEAADDLEALAALALWGGPCWPKASSMLAARLRMPALLKALEVTRFGGLPRGYATRNVVFEANADTVAKWGNWHCGHDKARFDRAWGTTEGTLFEAFIDGPALRVMVLGPNAWQIRLGGEDWKQSLHHADARLMPLEPELAADAEALRRHFDLPWVGVDYVRDRAGRTYLLEVNHVPNVTRFAEIRAAFLTAVCEWVRSTMGVPAAGRQD